MSTSGVTSTFVAGFNEEERAPLERLFRLTLAYLAVLIGTGMTVSIYLLRKPTSDNLLLLALATGIIGSATAAFVSALDRHAQGLEDRNGGATPEPEIRKERFSERMFYWFLGRPWLGAVVSVAVFWGGLGGNFTDSKTSADPSSGPKVAFYGILAGLFAKSVLDILRNLPKNVFRQ
jgi:hypothetical protein